SAAAPSVRADCGVSGSVVVTMSGPLPSGASSTDVMSKRSLALRISGVQQGPDRRAKPIVSRRADIVPNTERVSAAIAIGRDACASGAGNSATRAHDGSVRSACHHVLVLPLLQTATA